MICQFKINIIATVTLLLLLLLLLLIYYYYYYMLIIIIICLLHVSFFNAVNLKLPFQSCLLSPFDTVQLHLDQQQLNYTPAKSKENIKTCCYVWFYFQTKSVSFRPEKNFWYTAYNKIIHCNINTVYNNFINVYIFFCFFQFLLKTK